MCPPQSDKGRRKKKRQEGEEDKSRLDRDLKERKEKFFFQSLCPMWSTDVFLYSISLVIMSPSIISMTWELFYFSIEARTSSIFIIILYFSRRKHKKRFHMKCHRLNMTLQWKSVPGQRRQSIPGNVLCLTDRVQLSAENLPSALSQVAINRLSYKNAALKDPVTKCESIFDKCVYSM